MSKAYVEHLPDGDPCTRCGYASARHRVRSNRPARDPAEVRARSLAKVAKAAALVARPRKQKHVHLSALPIVGLDGEGWTTDDGEHHYVYAAAVDENGNTIGEATNLAGLSTAESLAWLTSLPGEGHASKSPSLSAFVFSGGYDLSKMLEDLTDRQLWLLARPEERRSKDERARSVVYKTDGKQYSLHYQRGRFSVQRIDAREKTKKGQWKIIGPRLVLWDCFSFFSCRFVKALEAWNIGTKEERARIEAMKEKRGGFLADEFESIAAYCREECRLLAQLMRKLITAHEQGGLTLKNFYGAGSSGAAMLDRWKAKRWLGHPPWLMRRPVAQAYSGGRFEVAQTGYLGGRREWTPNVQEVYGYDVSSAYPYAQSQGMPCMAHGTWEHVEGAKTEQAIERAPYALVKARVHKPPQEAWGPFPWRNAKGEITYPLMSDGSWVWRAEYLAAKRAPHCWNVEALEAWIYRVGCDCDPFGEVASMYKLRVEVGKDGPGLAIKLGVNANYGKLCQSIGNPPYQCWTWAGMITSHCRAQILDAIAAASSPWNVFQVATDGVFSTERLVLPKPEDTGTGAITEAATGKVVRKPLGGWEEKVYKQGMFVLRPGCYFPLGDETEDPEGERVRGRGVGRRIMHSHRQTILDHFDKWAASPLYRKLLPWPINYEFESVNIFIGFRAGIRGMPPKGAPRKREPGDPVKVTRSLSYGKWIEREQILSFSPMPKRSSLDEKTCRLRAWEIGEGEEQEPYGPAVGESQGLSVDAAALQAAELEVWDQPDGEPEVPWEV